MPGKPRREGYLMIDHRDSPGVDPELAHRVARETGRAAPAVTADSVFESGTVTCLHCGTIVILNPLRTRARHYCARCDGYVCDNPGCNLECRPLEKTLDKLQERFALLDHRGEPVAPDAFDAAPIYSVVSVSVPADTLYAGTAPPPAADPYRGAE